jgi:outer membrane protein TolC
VRRVLIAFVLIAVSGGCALNAPPKQEDVRSQSLPNLVVPPQWAEQGGAPGVVMKGWLAGFKDPQLEALVRDALMYNPDLQVAAARMEQAASCVARGRDALPTGEFVARVGGAMSVTQRPGRRGVSRGGWISGAACAGRAATQVKPVSRAGVAAQSIAAMVAKSWFLATEARLQKTNAEETARSAERLLGLTQDRLRVGRGDEYDVTVAKASLQTYRDVVQQLDLAYRQSLRALETLVGRYPAAAIKVPPQLAAKPGPVPVGMPSDLLERRLDVIAAERRVAAAFYRTEEAKAARLPRISLTAAVTSVSSELFVLKDRDNPVWSAGASLLAPIYLGGALQSQVEIRTAGRNRRSRIRANRRARVQRGRRCLVVRLGWTSGRRSWRRLSETSALELPTRYRVGSGDLARCSSSRSARTSLLRVQSEQLVQRVNLHLALGGGFDDR